MFGCSPPESETSAHPGRVQRIPPPCASTPKFLRPYLFGWLGVDQAAGMTSRGLLLAGTVMVGVFKLLGEVLAALLIER